MTREIVHFLQSLVYPGLSEGSSTLPLPGTLKPLHLLDLVTKCTSLPVSYGQMQTYIGIVYVYVLLRPAFTFNCHFFSHISQDPGKRSFSLIVPALYCRYRTYLSYM